MAVVTAAVSMSTFLAAVVFAPPAVAVTSNPSPAAGARKSATRLPFAVSGTASLSVDVASGNALFTDQLLTLPGVRNDVAVSLSYNSSVFGSSVPSAVTNSSGSGWVISGFDQRMVSNADNSVTYYGPGGLSGVFTSNGAGGYVSPPQFQATLTGSHTAGYTLTAHASQQKLSFNTTGRLISDTDRDGNTTSYSYDGAGHPSMITSSRGPSAGRTVHVSVNPYGGQITGLSQTSGSLTRSVSLGYSYQGHLASVTDAAGGITRFASAVGTDTGQLITLTNPLGKTSTLSFTSSKVSQVDQANPDGAGTASTRLSYPSASQTLVADPTTDQGQSVASVPHTTYTLTTDGTMLVSSATDPDGNQRSATYTGLANLASATPAAGGATSFSYGSNSGESLTKIASPGGASASASYTNTGASAYLPSSATDDAGNALKLTYDANGNQTGTAQGASGPSAKVTYNSDGTPATSASPGAASGVSTNYAYGNGDGDLTRITPPVNSSLAARSYTWDGFGRLATATDGNGATVTYSYDNADRISKVQYSDGTHEVDYSYDSNGHVTQRIDAAGTSTYRYDDLGHLLSVVNTANGKTVTYTYDLAGALATSVDALGTVTYSYDAAHQLTKMTYPQSGNTQSTLFANNGDGKRTDVWLQSSATHSVWAAHEHFSYDSSGRITSVLGQNGPATAPTTVENQTLCYAAGIAPTACTSPPATADRSNIQSTYESVTGETNTYTYDDHNRLTRDVVTGGSNPRTYSYGYDPAGNRTSAAVTGTSPTSQSLTFNDGNQISTAGYSYDKAGNLTTSPARTATFNAAGQQTSATVNGTTNTYTDAGTNQNEVLTETIPSTHSYNLAYGRPDANGLPTIDSVTVSGVGTGYVLSDPSGQPVMLSTSTGNTCLYLHDGTGNPIALASSFNTTALALRYDPYGAATRTDSNGLTPTAAENVYTFGEGIQDRATGEIKFGQRFYTPTTGTWTQQDTLNAPLDPANANRYTYAADDPVNSHDPTGRDGGIGTGCAEGAAGGLILGGLSGVDFTVVGAIGAAGLGCAFGAAEAYLGNSFEGGLVKATDYLNTAYTYLTS